MKSILITNISKYSLGTLAEFIESVGLFNVTVLVEPEHFTSAFEKFVNRYSLNVIVPIDCVEEGHNSVQAVEARNPGFEARVMAYPTNKIKLLRYAKRTPGYKSVIALAMSFPKVEVVIARGALLDSSFNNDVDFIVADEQQNGKPGVITITNDPFENYSVIDLEMLVKLKIVKEKKEWLNIKVVE